jgi:prefoldin subunit 5
MSGLDQLQRLHRWNLDQKRNHAAEIDRLIEKLNADMAALDLAMHEEIEAARGNIELERALPAYRKLMRERRQRMERSVSELNLEREKVQEEIQTAFNELKSTEQALANRAERQRVSERRKEQSVSDEIGRRMNRGQ